MSVLNQSNFTALPSKEIECMKFYKNHLMIGTLKGLAIITASKYLILNKNTKLLGEQIKDIELIGNGKIGIASMDGGLIEMELGLEIKTKQIVSELPINKIKNINDVLYIGTTGKGLFKLTNDSLFAFTSSNKELSNLNIFDICKSSNDIAIATFGKGVILLKNNYTTCLNQIEKLFRNIKYSEPKLDLPFLSENAKDICQKLLDKNPHTRLGSGPTDAEEIMKHPWF
jgi:serine/threonine protein kinase